MLRVDFNEKMGKIILKKKGITGKRCSWDICKANCMGAFISFYTDSDTGEKMANLQGFFGDEAHLKRCVGLVKGCDNLYKDYWQEIRLNTYYKDTLKMANLLAQAKFKVVLYYKEPKQKKC